MELHALFRDASDQLAMLGLPLGGTEEWADRLFIEGKGGTLLFSEAELDQAHLACSLPATTCTLCSVCTSPAAAWPLPATTCTQPG